VALGVGPAKVRFTLHSSHKLRLFYGVVAGLLAVLVLGVQLGSSPDNRDAESPETTTTTAVSPTTQSTTAASTSSSVP
jgi:hypothetical protein